jgi:uncharacterized protein (TIGR00369 family)
VSVEERIRASFAQQQFMATLGARIAHVAPGEVDIELPFDERLTQQDGFVHAGAVGAVLDSACGYAAYTLMDDVAGVLTVEYKLDLLRPAEGDLVVARGRVVHAGRTLTRCHGEASVGDRVVATMASTLIARNGAASLSVIGVDSRIND